MREHLHPCRAISIRELAAVALGLGGVALGPALGAAL